MPRLNAQDKASNEAAVRAAMERILRGDLPPGAKADLKTLAQLSGVTRTGFYAKRNRDGTSRPGAYQHLAEEFTARVQALQDAELTDRVVRRDAEVARLTEFRALAISRLAAQYDEIERLRSLLTQQAEAGDVVTRLPPRPRGAGNASFGSCG
ncbi:hypothetical protein ABZT45_27025 [Streptomyces sp. NPDC005356]|uniref:hypothetical protein n=1 Tax=Streptomyces sp. NPDC005356 TaxID=3157167 RepID=UPI0033B598EC